MNIPSHVDLVNAIADACRSTVISLFRNHPENFYYFSLFTSQELHPPRISAWSKESLDRYCLKYNLSEDDKACIRWSYGESPFFCYGEENFKLVDQLFSERPQLHYDMTDEEWITECNFRLDAMVEAIKRLDKEGLFGVGSERNKIVLLDEVMPPDYTNTERALLLNPPEAVQEWYNEAAEPEE
ncbi:MAG: DUF4303 domain-containing protein [Planctomycetaceae bacterium]